MFTFFILFISGFLIKIGDSIEDDGLKIRKEFAYIIGFLSGFLLAYIISSYHVLATLGISVVIAILLAKKIDCRTHSIVVASLFFFLAFFGFPKIDIFLTAFFVIVAILDEILNDLLKIKNIKRPLRIFFKYRLLLETSAFFVSVLIGEWLFFAGILTFDIGYWLATKFSEKFTRV